MDAMRLPGPITGEELMRECSGWPPERFESFCRSLLFAEGSVPVQPGARPGRADAGIDAEAAMPLDRPETLGLVGPGRNLYQFSRSDLFAREPREVLSQLAAKLRRDYLSATSAEQFQRFVALTNINLSLEQRRRIEAELRGPGGNGHVVLVFGAEVLSEYVNAHPHVLFAYFPATSGLVLQTQFARDYERTTGPLRVDLFGRERETEQLGRAINDPSNRVVLVQGRSGVGKTRLVLEALKGRAGSTIWSPSPDFPPVDLLRRLDASRVPLCLVVDDVDVERVRTLVDAGLACERLQLVVIARGREVGISPSRQGRVCDLAVEPLGPEDTLRLVRQVLGDEQPPREVNRIARDSGGLPSVAIEMAMMQGKGGEQALFQDLCVRFGLDTTTKDSLGVLGVLAHVQIEEPSPDLPVLARAFDVAEADLRKAVLHGLAAGHLVQRGRYAAVVPALVARLLAEEKLKCRPDALGQLLLALPPSSMPQLFEQLGRSEFARDAWRDMLGPNGAFSQAANLDEFPYVFDTLAGTLPLETLACVERLLRGAPAETRARQLGHVRWALLEIALRDECFEPAVHLLADLATGERGDPAIDILHRLFHVANHRAGPPLGVKGQVLQRLAHGHAKVAAEVAAGIASDRTLLEFLPAKRPSSTLEELEDMGEAALLAIEQALPYVPRATEGFSWTLAGITVSCACEEAGLRLLKRLSARRGPPWLTTDIREAAQEVLADYRPPLSTSRREDWEAFLHGLEGSHDLDAKVCRALGPSTRAEMVAELDRIDDVMEAEQAAEQAVRDLAKSVAVRPDALRLETWASLIRGDMLRRADGRMAVDTRARQFFHELGHLQADRPTLTEHLLPRLDSDFTADMFGVYVAGTLEKNPRSGATLLDRLSKLGTQEAARAYLSAMNITLFPPGWKGLAALVRQGLLPIRQAAAAWSLRHMSDEDLKRTLALFDDGSAETALALLEPFLGHPSGSELAAYRRQLAERALPAAHGGDRWGFVASKIAEEDLAWGLEMLSSVARVQRGHGLQNTALALWRQCSEKDRPASVKAVLGGSLEQYLEGGQQPYGGTYSWITATSDGATLLEFARGGPEAARVCAAYINADDDAFYSIAAQLIDLYPSDEELRSILDEVTGSAFASGSFVPVFEARVAQARKALGEATSDAARDWLLGDIGRTEERMGTERLHDQEHDVHRLAWYVRHGDPGMRRWAMARILRTLPEKIPEWLTRNQIEENLPFLKLNERERKAVQEMVASWGGHA